jgi:hypothetical protein
VRADPLRRRFGYGAAHFRVAALALAPAPQPAPFAGAGSAAATVVVGSLVVFGAIRALDHGDLEKSALRIVPLEAKVVPPEPIPVPEPEPVVVAAPEPPPPPPEPKPEPVVVAEAPKPKPKPIPKPEPKKAAPKLVRAEPPPPPPPPAPVARRMPPPVQIDAPKPPPAAPIETASQTAWRSPAVETRKIPVAPALPRVAIDSVGGPSNDPPEAPTRVSSLPPGVAGPKRAPAPAIPRMDLPAAAATTLPGDEPVTDPRARAAAPAPAPERPAARGPVRPVAFAGAASESATHTPVETEGPLRERIAAAPMPTAAARSEPDKKLRGVPLSTLAACRTDRREDELKLQVLAAVRNQRECSSAAGYYRFVETKNLNSFLMWIERAPGRAAADRCGELAYALSCLKQPGAK